MTTNQTDNIYLVYDRHCPVCERYSVMLRVREAADDLKLIDARQGGQLVDQITARGWDIDQGMVVSINKKLYFGADALHVLALLSSRVGLFNRMNYLMFRSPRMSKFFYPILKSGRNLLLKILRRHKINNLNLPDNDSF